MTPVISLLVNTLKNRNEELEKEIAELKQTLQFRHTTINDLRYSKKMLQKKLESIPVELF